MFLMCILSIEMNRVSQKRRVLIEHVLCILSIRMYKIFSELSNFKT